MEMQWWEQEGLGFGGDAESGPVGVADGWVRGEGREGRGEGQEGDYDRRLVKL